jgi:hypothetical protein
MAGKVILAMGKAVVRAAEYIVVSRRLSAIKTAMPCSDDDLRQSGSLESMFDDLLELSRYVWISNVTQFLRLISEQRPGLYSETVQTQALQIILVQISKEQTHHLRRSIIKWEDPAEIVRLLSEIMGVVLFSKRG